MTDKVVALLALIGLVEYVLGLLVRVKARPADAVPVSSLPDLPAWDEPDRFRVHGASRPAQGAVNAAREGNAGVAMCQLTDVAETLDSGQAHALVSAVRYAYAVDPRVALAVTEAAREVLGEPTA